jgi:beta-lactamase class A
MDESTAREQMNCIRIVAFSLLLTGCATSAMKHYTLDYDTPVDPALQARLTAIDSELRAKYGMTEEQTDVGVLDLKRMRLAMIHPDKIEYAASVAKVGILLAYFQLHPGAAKSLDPQTRHELGLMAKVSSNEVASKFSREIGISSVQRVLDSYHFYDANRGGGIWFGKHYGPGSERIGDPIANHSHGATVRQLLRFWLLLEQGKLVSPAASKTMREIFESPDIPHDDIKFVKGLDGRGLHILRKWGSWEDWFHDSASISGPGRRYILVAMTKHPRGDEYLVDLARAVDDVFRRAEARRYTFFSRSFQRFHASSRAFLFAAYASRTFCSASAAGGGASPARMKPWPAPSYVTMSYVFPAAFISSCVFGTVAPMRASLPA